MLTETWVAQPDLKLNYVISPETATPLILLHGVTRRWQSFLPLMGPLSVHRQLIVPDLRGHGLSSRPESGYLVRDYAADITAFIQDRDQPVALYGHSLGALVAAAVAVEIPEQVTAIILEDPPFNTMNENIAATTFHSFFKAMQTFAGDQRSIHEIARDLAEVRLYNPDNGAEYRLGDLRDGVSLRFTAGCLQQLDPAVLLPIVEGRWLEGYVTESVFRQLSCPALLIQADATAGGMLPDDDADQLDSWSDSLTRIKVPGAGHLVHWAATQQVVNQVLGFLATT
ncbi:Tropinesterase [Gimesia panareensis]|uniref:Tropinesterase n=1 Tax=Gimesia panareensis TaxID=2527978 RepID=A0A518FPD2_9PLAN|nr:alpha/beta hydrolase [Gimesia panareensis]QDV18125.1 Tropinesterase [Gimesia panareensis]